MSGEDDTFDIDIYGDESQDQQQQQQPPNDNPDDQIDFDDDANYGYDDQGNGQDYSHQDDNGVKQDAAEQDTKHENGSTPQPQPQQGTKRKAEDDYDQQGSTYDSHSHTQATDPSATPALKLNDLHWWTTEEDLRAFCAAANVEDQLQDVSFGEHKINGKSRGEAYLEFSSAGASEAVKIQIEKREAPKDGQTEGKRINPFHIYYTPVGNPFKGRDSGAQGKKDYSAQPASGRGGAYNQNFSRGGGFRGGGFNRGGGGGFQRGGFQGGMNQQQNGGWNQGMGGMGGGGFNNPMMGMGMNMAGMGGMNMGGYNNMGRGGGGMMGRGGFQGGMGNMGGMMGGGRGGMMGGRGGWGAGGGFQQGNFGGGGGGYGMGMQGQQGGPNKRMKPDG